LKRGDLSNLPIADATCDAALCILALTYLPDPPTAVAEMARILRPGGRVVIVDLLPHDREDFRRQTGQKSRGFEPQTVRQWLAEAGFAAPAVRPVSPAPQSKGPALFLAVGERTS